MTNLLPLTLRKRQANRRLLVLLATVGLVCMSAALFVAAALLPAYSAAVTEVANIQARSAQPESDRALAVKKERETALALRKTVEALTQLAKSGNGIDMVQRVSEARPEGVALTAFTFTNKGATSTLNVQGTARNRDALIAFVRAVEAFDGVQSAEVPITALAKSDDNSFLMLITGSF
jgi:Tfp pilus assembly protein PilN